jgi:uncharacterized protein (DUF2249 family)
MNPDPITLDVREDIRLGREPFLKIIAAADELGPGQSLRLLAPFEPVPLYRVLGQQGFTHAGSAKTDGTWEILFTKPAARGAPLESNPAVAAAAGVESTCAGTAVTEVDARGLEPPQPMVRILEAVASLSSGVDLRARTDRRPMHLYAELEARGFSAETSEHPEGGFVTYVRRR